MSENLRGGFFLTHTVDGKALDRVNQEKDLGILIIKDSKESQQRMQVYGKASRM